MTNPLKTVTELLEQSTEADLDALSADELLAHIVALDLALESAKDHSATSQQPDDNLTP